MQDMELILRGTYLHIWQYVAHVGWITSTDHRRLTGSFLHCTLHAILIIIALANPISCGAISVQLRCSCVAVVVQLLCGCGAVFISDVSDRIQDLEMAVERMKQQQDQLQKRLREETERKARLEVIFQLHQLQL